VTNYRDKVKDHSRKENTLRSARADESGAGTGRLSAPIDLEGPERRKHEGWAVKDWVHPAVRRGTIYWTAHGIVSAGLAVALVFLALRNPSTELRLWAIAAVIFAVLVGFLVRKQIKNLRHEYRYEEDDDTTDQS
jgi:Flp pilus assembly protein TadB